MTKEMSLERGFTWWDGTLSDLGFADGIALIGDSRLNIQDMAS